MQIVLLLCLLSSAFAFSEENQFGGDLNLPPQQVSQDRSDASTLTQLMDEMPASSDAVPAPAAFEDDRFAARKAPSDFGAAALSAPKNVPANYIPQGTKTGDPLDDALNLVSEQIVNNAKKMHDEKGWVGKVGSLVEEMNTKVKKVKGDVEKIRQDTIGLLKKKRQIENAKLQKKLNDQLKAAQEDKDALETAIEHVKTRTDDFVEKKTMLVTTIGDLQKQIKNLQGQAKEDEKDPGDTKSDGEHVAEKAQAALAEFSEDVSLHLDKY